jgi:hypothetical protein
MRVKEQDRLSLLIEVKFLRQGDVARLSRSTAARQGCTKYYLWKWRSLHRRNRHCGLYDR